MRVAYLTAASVSVFLVALASGAQTPARRHAVDATVADIQAVLKTAPPDAAADLPVRVVDAGGYNVGVYVVNRPKGIKNSAIYHETKVTEVYHILKGSGTLVTGGTVIGPIVREAQGTTILSMLNNVRGTAIKDGVTRRLTVGDVVVIPGYEPHWWSQTDSDLTYLVIRPDPDKILPIK
jgi:mannose-6-phosphate isomerase-like protein (cupin superfamily)